MIVRACLRVSTSAVVAVEALGLPGREADGDLRAHTLGRVDVEVGLVPHVHEHGRHQSGPVRVVHRNTLLGQPLRLLLVEGDGAVIPVGAGGLDGRRRGGGGDVDADHETGGHEEGGDTLLDASAEAQTRCALLHLTLRSA